MVTIRLQFWELQNGYNLVTNRNKNLQNGYSRETPAASYVRGRATRPAFMGFPPAKRHKKKNRLGGSNVLGGVPQDEGAIVKPIGDVPSILFPLCEGQKLKECFYHLNVSEGAVNLGPVGIKASEVFKGYIKEAVLNSPEGIFGIGKAGQENKQSFKHFIFPFRFFGVFLHLMMLL